MIWASVHLHLKTGIPAATLNKGRLRRRNLRRIRIRISTPGRDRDIDWYGGMSLFEKTTIEDRIRGGKMTVGERVLALIKERGLTQKEVSIRTGIPQSTISDWRSKKINPGSEKIMVLSEVLGVSPQYLLSGSEGGKYSETQELTVFKEDDDYSVLIQYRRLNQDNRKRLQGYLQALKDMQEGE